MTCRLLRHGYMVCVCLCASVREDKGDAVEEMQDELDAVKQSELRLRNEVRNLSHYMVLFLPFMVSNRDNVHC